MLFYYVLILVISKCSLAIPLDNIGHGRVSRQNDACITPNNHPGSCVSIRNCSPLFALVNHLDEPIKIFLRRSFCGRNATNGTPKVCCPQSTDPIHFDPLIFRTSSDSDTSEPASAAPGKLMTPSSTPLSTSGADTKFTFTKCGMSGKNALKIVGGNDAALGDWPWMAALYYRTNLDSHLVTRCSGTLISREWVITAAHCFIDSNLILVSVRLGDLNLDDNVADGATPTDVPIEKIIIHPEFNTRPPVNDIALIKLKSPVEYTRLIQPICLFNESEVYRSNDFYANKAPFIMGWGKLNFEGSLSSALQEAQIEVVDSETCSTNYVGHNVVIDNRVICASGKGKDTCKGDSGGPLVIPQGSRHFLAGVVSFGVRCGEPNYPGVYTRVVEFSNWIERVTQLKT